MFIKDSTVQFVWNLDKTSTVYAEDYFDLRVQEPDGVVSYSEGVNGAGWATAFTAPDAVTDGQLTTDLVLSKTGLYNIILANGNSANYTVLASQLVMVVAQDTVSNKSVTLD